MYIPSLEARLASNAKSPSFARLASYHLKEGQIQKAVDLCLEGLKLYPNYGTAHLVLGRCYEAMGRNIEAMLEYRRALKAMPDNPIVQGLLKHVEQREQEAFKAFSEESAHKLKERKNTLTFEKFVEEGTEKKESTAEFLLKRLQEVKKTAPSAVAEGQPEEAAHAQGVAPSKIVTATLAEIYATQGEYKEAIDAYRKLVSQRPIEAERYAKRIVQLEELSRLQQVEHQEH
ncbi:MAG: tetratricopeptide repeat protein [Bacteroidota bacterium]